MPHRRTAHIAPCYNMLPPSYLVMDITYQDNAVFSLWKRIGTQLPGVAGERIRKWGCVTRLPLGNKPVVREDRHEDFLCFAVALSKIFPIMTSPDYSLESYVENSNRSKKYADALVEGVISKKHIADLFAFSFLKFESYDKEKFPRTICALSDEIKATMGPIFRQLDHSIFHSEKVGRFFVKTVPVKERAEHIRNMFGSNQVCLADYSSFECCHRGVFGKAVWAVFRHMIGDSLPQGLVGVLHHLFCGTKYLKFKTLGVESFVDGTLMSGAPWTSSANAVLNFLILSYMRLRAAYPCVEPEQLVLHLDEFVGIVEGDDSLTLGGAYDETILAELGLPCKSEVHSNYASASFCGILKPLDEDALVADPVKILCNFFWLPMNMIELGPRKQSEYLRAKALSYYYQYADCPIVGQMAYSVLARTSGYHVKKAHSYDLGYKRDMVLELALSAGKFWSRKPDVPLAARNIVATLYGIREDEQIEIEKSFVSWEKGGSVWLPPIFQKFAQNTKKMMEATSWPLLTEIDSAGLPNIRGLAGVWYNPSTGLTSTKQPKRKIGPCPNPINKDTTYYPGQSARQEYLLDNPDLIKKVF